MSDPTNAAPAANAQDSTPTKRKRERKSTYSVSDLARARLKARGVRDIESKVTDECKVVRGILRSQFGFVAKNDATVRKAKDYANDRKPWPTNMNAHTFDVVVKGKRPAKSGK